MTSTALAALRADAGTSSYSKMSQLAVSGLIQQQLVHTLVFATMQ
jgi:hypothetical protein